MSLLDAINKYKAQNSNSNDDEVNLLDALKNKTILRASRKNQKVLVRILPPKAGSNDFYAEFRQWFASITKKDGSKSRLPLHLSAQRDANDPLQAYINNADKQNKLVDDRGRTNYPGTHFYVNAVQLQYNPTQGMIMDVTPQGEPNVYVLDLSKTQMDSLIQQLSDPINNPNTNPNTTGLYKFTPTEEQKGWSFISSGLAYPVQITYNNVNNHISYELKTIQNFPLAPLPQGWESTLEDLNALVQPSYITNPSLVQFVVNQKTAELASQPAQPPKQQFDNGIFGNIAPQKQPTPETTPVAPQAQPRQYQPQAPQPQAPVQQAPQAPVQPAQAPQSFSAQPTATPEEQEEIENLGNPLSQFGNTVAQNQTQAQPKVQPQPASQASQAPQPAQQQSATPLDTKDTDAAVNDALREAGLGNMFND